MLYKSRIVLFVVIILYLFVRATTPWGFYGHRLINRLAVYTVPAPLSLLYKTNIEYIAAHAVDPDKRRYATKHEGVRHYIDIDVWGDDPFVEVPRNLGDAVIKYGVFSVIRGGDTTKLAHQIVDNRIAFFIAAGDQEPVVDLAYRDFRTIFYDDLMPLYYEDDWVLDLAQLSGEMARPLEELGYQAIHLQDKFSPFGILPYHLETMHRKLTRAFEQRDKAAILRVSSEYGHYIGDAHVPLHTTQNYNGQMTDQVGIHAFWESRIPELFAEEQYDFLVGAAEYVDDISSYVWQIVEDSHIELDSVLLIEKELSTTFPSDQQYCYDERLSRTIRIQCPEYAAAYQARMGDMVERRMQASIKAIGDLWYSAWIDGGEPPVGDLRGADEIAKEEYNRDPSLKGIRQHDF